MNPKFPLFILALGTIALAAGCKFPSHGTVYDRSQAGRSMSVMTGDIVSARDVEVSGRSTIIGVGGGAVVGGAAGSGLGKGVGSSVASAVSAVGGAIIGEAIEEGVTRKRAQELLIKTSRGETIAVVQTVGADGALAVGEHVQILEGGAGTTVRRLF